jgi:NAD(P)-dependent dehydrogenase (short-subunit alcohol dehydrogenase family)
MARLEDKTAIITGGASGIGESAVRLFIHEGCRVIIADTNAEAGARLARELGASALFQQTDVTKEEDLKAAVDLAVATFGRLDCMFNNAGMSGLLKPIEDVSVEEYDRLTSVNLKGVFLGLKYAAPVMKKQRSGSIINTSSMGGLKAENAPHIYSAVKAAVNHLSKVVANELGAWNVRVNAISPGAIVTPIFTNNQSLSAEEVTASMQKAEEALSQHQPIPRAGQPGDIARAALWLASDDSTFVTGANIVVDGGATCGEKWSVMMEQLAKMSLITEANK